MATRLQEAASSTGMESSWNGCTPGAEALLSAVAIFLMPCFHTEEGVPRKVTRACGERSKAGDGGIMKSVDDHLTSGSSFFHWDRTPGSDAYLVLGRFCLWCLCFCCLAFILKNKVYRKVTVYWERSKAGDVGNVKSGWPPDFRKRLLPPGWNLPGLDAYLALGRFCLKEHKIGMIGGITYGATTPESAGVRQNSDM